MTEIESIRGAILEGADGDTVGALPRPQSFRGAVVRADEQEMFAGLPSEAKDPRKSTHVEDVPLPELAPDEAYIGVMASAINFNTVWTSIFEPLPTFQFLARLGKESVWGKRHDQPFHVMGSDAAGVVLRVGSAVRNWKPGDQVTVHCNYVDDQDPSAHDDSMLAVNERIWGFESNYGGLAEIALAKANQLMPKPTHLTWEEAACNALCNSTSYRMIVSPNGAQMTQGQSVLVWGASGGIGAYAAQYVMNGGGTPVGVVSSPERAALLHEMGVEHVIDRKAEGYQFWKDEHTQDPAEWRRLVAKGQLRARAVAECRPLRAVFYAASDWLRLATKLAGSASPCAEYYVSVPPLVADKTTFRRDQASRIRALGPNVHTMAEIHFATWERWVASTGSSWFTGGVTARASSC